MWLKRGFSRALKEKAMPDQLLSQHGIGLFDTVPPDFLGFGQGASFEPKKVQELLTLKKQDVSRIARVSEKSVRYDQHIPEAVRERLEEIAATINMVAGNFNGDAVKTAAWFRARNPLLGDVSPRDMIRLGRYERLRRFIINAMFSGVQSASIKTS
jgi:hypothetical protein